MRFLHTADLHLGRSFPYEREDDRIIGRKDRFRTFERVLKLGIQEQVDYLFLVGDIFEQEKVSSAEVDYVLNCLAHAPFTTLLLLGNHDYKLYDDVAARLPENVYLFSNEIMDRYEDRDRGVVFYGTSWTRASYNKILQFEGTIGDEGLHRVLLHHGNWSGGDGYFPVDANLLHAFDYVALGHVHKPIMYENKLQMCGTPEPLDRTDRGKLGVVLGELDEVLTTRYVPLAARLLKQKNYLRRDGADDEAIVADAKALGHSKDFIYSFHLSGAYSGILDREPEGFSTKRAFCMSSIGKRICRRSLSAWKENTKAIFSAPFWRGRRPTTAMKRRASPSVI